MRRNPLFTDYISVLRPRTINYITTYLDVFNLLIYYKHFIFSCRSQFDVIRQVLARCQSHRRDVLTPDNISHGTLRTTSDIYVCRTFAKHHKCCSLYNHCSIVCIPSYTLPHTRCNISHVQAYQRQSFWKTGSRISPPIQAERRSGRYLKTAT